MIHQKWLEQQVPQQIADHFMSSKKPHFTTDLPKIKKTTVTPPNKCSFYCILNTPLHNAGENWNQACIEEEDEP